VTQALEIKGNGAAITLQGSIDVDGWLSINDATLRCAVSTDQEGFKVSGGLAFTRLVVEAFAVPVVRV
jgi:hypothetical protein